MLRLNKYSTGQSRVLYLSREIASPSAVFFVQTSTGSALGDILYTLNRYRANIVVERWVLYLANNKQAIGLSRQNRSPIKLVRPDWFLAEKSAKTGPPGPLLLLKLVRPDRLWLSKMVPSCQNQSPMGDRFWQKIICQNRSPLKVTLLFLRAHSYMDAAIISSYARLSS